MTQNVISNGRCVAQGTPIGAWLGARWEQRLICGYNDANPTQQACGGDSGENWEPATFDFSPPFPQWP